MRKRVNILVGTSNKEETEELNLLIPDSIPEKEIKIEKIFSDSLPDFLKNLKEGEYHILILSSNFNSGRTLEFLKDLGKGIKNLPEIIFIDSGNETEFNSIRIKRLKKGNLNPKRMADEIFDACSRYPDIVSQNSVRQSYLKQMEAMVKSMLEGVIMVDKSDNIVVINPAAKKYLQFLNENFKGEEIKEIAEINEILSFIKRGEDCVLKEIEVIKKNLFLRFEGLPVKDINEDLIGIVILIRDVTTEKKVDKMKDDFITVVSHELRTPLTTMKEFISILLDEIPGKINSSQREYLGIIGSNIERLARIINEILDIAKIESGKIQIQRELLDLNEIVREVAKTFIPLASEKGLYLKLTLPEFPVTTYGDRDRLAQIFSNLIHNAIKFTSQGGIEVRVFDKGDKILSQVRDTGIGIAKENLPKLFMKFQQFERDSGEKSSGTGLGLSITKNLVELHKGKIWAESEYGKGSVFAFVLPKYSHQQALLELCAENLNRCILENKSFSLLFIEIINLQEVREQIGLEKLSQLKKDLEIVFRNTLRRNEDLIFKDENCFVILLNMTPKENALVVKERIVQALLKYIQENFKNIKELKFKIGLAGYPEDGHREEELLENAKVNEEEIPLNR